MWFKGGGYGPNTYIFDNTISGTSASYSGTLNVTGVTNLASNLNVTGNTLLSGVTNLSSNLNVTGNTLLTGVTNLSSNLNVTGNTLLTGVTNLSSNLNVTGNSVFTGNSNFTAMQTMRAPSGWTYSYVTRGTTFTTVPQGSGTSLIASWQINTTNGVTYRIKASINGSGSFQNGYDFVCPESTYFGRYYNGMITLSAPTITYYNSNPGVYWEILGADIVIAMPQNSGQNTYVFVYWEIQLIYPSSS